AIRSICARTWMSTGAASFSAVAAASASATAAPAASALAVAPRRALLALARRRVLGPLDQLLRLNEVAVLVLGDQLQADPAALFVTSWTITSSTSPRPITSSMWPTRPGPTFET